MVSIDFTLEYVTTSLEIHHDAIESGGCPPRNRGTVMASCQLVERLSGKVIACAFFIELTQLTGRER